MLSDRTTRIAGRFLVTLCALAWLALLILLWVPVVMLPSLKDAEPGSYGVITFTWTIIGFVLAGASFFAGRLLPTKTAALVNAFVFLTAIAAFFGMVGSPRQPLAVGVVVIAASLLPQLGLGWLLGNGIRLRRVAHAL